LLFAYSAKRPALFDKHFRPSVIANTRNDGVLLGGRTAAIVEYSLSFRVESSLAGHDMLVNVEDITDLAGFPLLWRWTQETHAMFEPDELVSIRSINPGKARVICQRSARMPLVPGRPSDRLLVKADTDRLVVSHWLQERVPEDEAEILLLWDQDTGALVPRRLFIDRWDAFWYPSSDDLGVVGNAGEWQLEMYHHGVFEFLGRGAG
jgi:hypothetical protein